MTDHAGLVALIVLMGGIVFWFIVFVCAGIALMHGIKRLMVSAWDVLTQRRYETAE